MHEQIKIHHEAPKYPKRDSRNFQRHELLSNVQDLTYSLHKSYFIFSVQMDYLFLSVPREKSCDTDLGWNLQSDRFQQHCEEKHCAAGMFCA